MYSSHIFMKNSILYALAFLCLIGMKGELKAQKFDNKVHFDFNPSMKNAYTSALHLRINDSRLAIQSEKSSNPNNAMALYVENWTDFMEILADENPKTFEKMLPNRGARISKIKSGDQESPYFLYTQAGIDIQWAWLHLQFNQVNEAVKLLKSTQGDLERNIKYFPDFLANKMLLGVVQVMSEFTTTKYIANTPNALNLGLKNLKEVIQTSRFEFAEEANFWYAMILLELEVEDDKTWNVLNANALNHQKSLFGNYLLARINLMQGNMTKAQSILGVMPTGDKYHRFAQIDFIKGLACLYKQESKADQYFKTFLDNYRGVHRIKEAYQKYAWSALLQGKNDEYKRLMEGLAQNGNSVHPYDAWAEMEAKQKTIPNVELLKFRLNFMAASYDKAIHLMENMPALKGYEDAEFLFFKGKMLHKMKKTDDALSIFEKIATNSENKTRYIAALSYYYAGMIYADRKETAPAIKAFENCLKMNPDVMKKSIHWRARMQLDILQPVQTANSK